MTRDYYDKYLCKPVGEFDFDPQTPKYRKFPDVCREHEGNTCCLHSHVNILKKKITKVKDEAFRLTPKCFDATKNVMCSVCDSDVGIHKKRGLCKDMCFTWYDLCMSDSFIIRGVNNSLDFPNYDDPPQLIRPLYEIVSTVDEFCERMGFPVFEDPYCYNGIPVASKVHLNNKQTFWQEMFTTPTNKSPLDWSVV